MNKQRKKLLIAVQLCPLTLFMVSSGSAKMSPAPRPHVQQGQHQSAAAEVPRARPREELITGNEKHLNSSINADSLPPPALSQMSAMIGENTSAYHVLPQPGGFRMNNRNNGLSAEFTRAGVAFHQQAYHWGLSLRGY